MLLNKYNFLSRLGGGTFGSAVLVESPSQGKNAVLKLFPKKLASTRLSKRLYIIHQTVEQDLNLFPVPEIVEDADFYYFVSELFAPEDAPVPLTHCLHNRKTSLSEYEISGILAETLRGLENLHRFSYPHLNIKPNNLVIHNQQIQITDWGLQEIYLHFRKITNRYEEEAEGYVALSNNTKEVVLASAESNLFASPEVLREGPKGPASDIYSVGKLASYLLTGYKNVRTHNVTSLRPEKSPEWDKFISTACDINPKKRFPSAAAMLEALPFSNDSFDPKTL